MNAYCSELPVFSSLITSQLKKHKSVDVEELTQSRRSNDKLDDYRYKADEKRKHDRHTGPNHQNKLLVHANDYEGLS